MNFGYILEYKIMGEFVEKNPNVSIEEWTEMKAEDFYLNTSYSK